MSRPTLTPAALKEPPLNNKNNSSSNSMINLKVRFKLWIRNNLQRSRHAASAIGMTLASTVSQLIFTIGKSAPCSPLAGNVIKSSRLLK